MANLLDLLQSFSHALGDGVTVMLGSFIQHTKFQAISSKRLGWIKVDFPATFTFHKNELWLPSHLYLNFTSHQSSPSDQRSKCRGWWLVVGSSSASLLMPLLEDLDLVAGQTYFGPCHHSSSQRNHHHQTALARTSSDSDRCRHRWDVFCIEEQPPASIPCLRLSGSPSCIGSKHHTERTCSVKSGLGAGHHTRRVSQIPAKWHASLAKFEDVSPILFVDGQKRAIPSKPMEIIFSASMWHPINSPNIFWIWQVATQQLPPGAAWKPDNARKDLQWSPELILHDGLLNWAQYIPNHTLAGGVKPILNVLRVDLRCFQV